MITIICVGKIKEKFFKEAINEYTKRISKYTKLNIIELEDFDYDDKNLILKKEAELILKNINIKSHIITLEIDGTMYDSIEFGNNINNRLIHNSNITFIIGGSYGISDNVKKLSTEKISFSKLTFPHQLFRIILLEQIYRSYKILNNESYH